MVTCSRTYIGLDGLRLMLNFLLINVKLKIARKQPENPDLPLCRENDLVIFAY
jgi:hypothetical protein